MDPITAMALIGSACSIASYLQSNGLDVNLINIRELLPRFAPKAPPVVFDDLVSPAGQQFISLLVINPDLLDYLAKRIKGSQQSYKECLDKAKRPQERDVCDRIFERRICEDLNRIMDRNDDKLPPLRSFQNLWKSFRCARTPNV